MGRPQMSNCLPKPGTPAAIAGALFCSAVLSASAIQYAADLDGPLGFVFFLLVVATPIFIAMAVSVTNYRLMLRRPPTLVRTPERMLFAAAGFIVTCGSGPLAISLAIAGITRREGTLGAAGMWAIASIVLGAVVCSFAIAVMLLRPVL